MSIVRVVSITHTDTESPSQWEGQTKATGAVTQTSYDVTAVTEQAIA